MNKILLCITLIACSPVALFGTRTSKAAKSLPNWTRRVEALPGQHDANVKKSLAQQSRELRRVNRAAEHNDEIREGLKEHYNER